MELKLFDCNCTLGPARENAGGSFADAAALHAGMKRYHINRALVYSSIAKEYIPQMGNELLYEEIAAYPDLYAAWIGLPTYTGEFPDANTLKRQAKQNHVCALRLCPEKHIYQTADWCCGELFGAMSEMHMPVFLDYDIQHWSDPLPWNEIFRLAQTYPSIPFVLTRVGCAANRNLFALLDQCPNVYFEISYYDVNRGLETVTERFGARRMLFGTNAPLHNPACPIGLIWYADISEADKQKIAGENLQNLIGGICYDV